MKRGSILSLIAKTVVHEHVIHEPGKVAQVSDAIEDSFTRGEKETVVVRKGKENLFNGVRQTELHVFVETHYDTDDVIDIFRK